MTATYGDMQARIADDLYQRTDLTSQIQNAIQSAITHYQRQRFWFNEGIDTASTVSGSANIAVPTDFQGEDTLKVTYSNYPFPMQKITWDLMEIYRTNAAQALSVPEFWTYYADQFWLYPTPNGIYTLTLSYCRNLGALSAASDTNAWMTEGEEMIRNRAKAAVRIDAIHEDAAISERNSFAFAGEPFFSTAEKQAYQSLRRVTVAKESTGQLVPTQF